jgi:hypothetical protein
MYFRHFLTNDNQVVYNVSVKIDDEVYNCKTAAISFIYLLIVSLTS